jgi:cytoskeletal protein CcmA (bactofilin family)
MSDPEPCVIGLGASFEGKISFSNAARIEGNARGEVRGDGTLVVARTGVVEASVNVDRLVIEGSVRGEVRAKTAVEVGAHGRIEGSLITPKLRVEEGAFVAARVEMGES